MSALTVTARDSLNRIAIQWSGNWNDNVSRARSPWADVRLIGVINLITMSLYAPVVGLVALVFFVLYSVSRMWDSLQR